MILLALAAFESVDESYEKIARILGKGRLETFLRVSLPLAEDRDNSRVHYDLGKISWRVGSHNDDGL